MQEFHSGTRCKGCWRQCHSQLSEMARDSCQYGCIIPTSPTILLIAFCVLAPLALFRGPLMIWGSGIALVSILQAMGVFSENFLFALFLIPPVAIVACACPTQSWTMWGLSYSKLEPKQYIKTNLAWAWIILIIVEVLAVKMIGTI